jgi:signal peptidase I
MIYVSKRARTALDWIATIVVAVAVILALETWVAKPYRIPSSSMEPTLDCTRTRADSGCTARFADRILADRLVYRFRGPHRGEIAVFHEPQAARLACRPANGSVLVKRVVGLPGERISERGGWIYVDGKRLPEHYLPAGTHRADAADSFRGPVTVPPNSYFMLGDNRAGSCDSRTWGVVSRSSLIGEVFLTYWPPSRIATH